MTLEEPEILGASILIVDDQPANVELLEAMLAGSGYTRVHSTSNPREVFARHREHNYDLILLDLQMPDMDGFEVMEGLKELEPSSYLPVLVLTAQPSQKLRALQAGAKDFVTKPFDILEVQTRIRNMLEVRLLYKRIEADNRKLEETVQARTLELRESEARFRSLVELASDWYWEQDEHGKFTKVSGPALEMLGLGEAGEAGAADAAEMQSPRWNQRERALLDEKLATRKPFIDLIYSRINADGSEQFLQTSGEPVFDQSGRFTGYRGIGMDVTGRMRPAAGDGDGAALQRIRQDMEASEHAVLLVDGSSLRVLEANAAACRIAGLSREELVGRATDGLGKLWGRG
jgi:PAS domain S-box-containing protein